MPNHKVHQEITQRAQIEPLTFSIYHFSPPRLLDFSYCSCEGV